LDVFEPVDDPDSPVIVGTTGPNAYDAPSLQRLAFWS
jgi:hypothetical protein